MPQWTVLLRTSDGTQMIPVTADLASESDDGKTLEFSNVAAIDEAISIMIKVDEVPVEERKEFLWKLIRAFGRVTVASFKIEAVEGYYQEPLESGSPQ